MFEVFQHIISVKQINRKCNKTWKNRSLMFSFLHDKQFDVPSLFLELVRIDREQRILRDAASPNQSKFFVSKAFFNLIIDMNIP